MLEGTQLPLTLLQLPSQLLLQLHTMQLLETNQLLRVDFLDAAQLGPLLEVELVELRLFFIADFF